MTVVEYKNFLPTFHGEYKMIVKYFSRIANFSWDVL